MHRSPVSKWLRFRDGGAAQTPPQNPRTRASGRDAGSALGGWDWILGHEALSRGRPHPHTAGQPVPGAAAAVMSRTRPLAPTNGGLLGGPKTLPWWRTYDSPKAFVNNRLPLGGGVGAGPELGGQRSSPPPSCLGIGIPDWPRPRMQMVVWGTTRRRKRYRRTEHTTNPTASRAHRTPRLPPREPEGGGHHQGPRGRGGWFGRPGP